MTPAPFLIDAYKASHQYIYDAVTEGKLQMLFSTWTPRSNKIARSYGKCLPEQDGKVVFFGVTGALRDLYDEWTEWFARDEEEVVDEYETLIEQFFKVAPNSDAIRELHRFGSLPIVVYHLPEGTVTDVGVVQLVVYNVDERFAWFTNYVESYLSTKLWGPSTVASIARNFRQVVEDFTQRTCDDSSHLDWQCHDFSFRGKDGLESAESAGLGHMLQFSGTDTIPALFRGLSLYRDFSAEDYGSVPATEHSIMCLGGPENELRTYERIIDAYPTGIVSIVSDTWDYWRVLMEYLPRLKDKILARDGKVVIRPDSGDPLKIICGDADATAWPANQGSIRILDAIFGSTVNAKGFKVLNAKVGLIYGDSITLERMVAILTELERMGYASSNVVFGVGSYTYQVNSRDTFGFAMKATASVIDGVLVEMCKDPVTDDGTKRSFKGLLTTRYERGTLRTVDRLSEEEALRGDTAFVLAEICGGDGELWQDVVARATSVPMDAGFPFVAAMNGKAV